MINTLTTDLGVESRAPLPWLIFFLLLKALSEAISTSEVIILVQKQNFI